MHKDYLVITVHDNDFYRDLLVLGILFNYNITREQILENKCVNLVILGKYILDIMICNYTLRTFGKTNYEEINKRKNYIEKN